MYLFDFFSCRFYVCFIIITGLTACSSGGSSDDITIFTVSGCGGTLAGETYTTGAITSDCTITASFKAPTLTSVSALYPTNGR